MVVDKLAIQADILGRFSHHFPNHNYLLIHRQSGLNVSVFLCEFSAIDASGGQPSNYASNGVISTGESGVSSTGEDDGYSQAESSIKSGEVIASAQGTKVSVYSTHVHANKLFDQIDDMKANKYSIQLFSRTVELLKHKFKVLTVEAAHSLHQLKLPTKIDQHKPK